jgi:hypothetical protein
VTDAEIIALVREMRAAQKAYFKARARADLEASKVLERKVDKALTERAAGQGALV